MSTISKEVANLRLRILSMGEMAVEMVDKAVEACDSSNRYELVQEVFEAESALDQMQLEVDQEAVRTLTVHSPVASDLRFVITVSRIVSELERIGDQANNLCEILQFAASKHVFDIDAQVEQMASIVVKMLSDSLEAFVKNDVSLARATIAADDLVDALNDQITQDLLSDKLVRDAIAGENSIVRGFIQVIVARALERIADHATNISEEVIYIVKGEDIRHNDSDATKLN